MVLKVPHRLLTTPLQGGVWTNSAVVNVGAVVSALAGMELSGYQVLNLLGAGQPGGDANAQKELLAQMQSSWLNGSADPQTAARLHPMVRKAYQRMRSPLGTTFDLSDYILVSAEKRASA